MRTLSMGFFQRFLWFLDGRKTWSDISNFCDASYGGYSLYSRTFCGRSIQWCFEHCQVNKQLTFAYIYNTSFSFVLFNSSGLNSLAAVTMQDILISACNKKFTEKTKTLVTKGLAVGYGIISYIFVFVVKYLPGVLEVCKNLNYVFSNYKIPIWKF